MPIRGARLALALLPIAVVVAGCGSSSSSTSSASAAQASKTSATVDATQVEQGIESSLSTSSVKVSSAKCPTNIPSNPGQTFTCTVALSNGATGDVTVTQKTRNQFTYAFKEGS